jgi:hypothetical protein
MLNFGTYIVNAPYLGNNIQTPKLFDAHLGAGEHFWVLEPSSQKNG